MNPISIESHATVGTVVVFGVSTWVNAKGGPSLGQEAECTAFQSAQSVFGRALRVLGFLAKCRSVGWSS